MRAILESSILTALSQCASKLFFTAISRDRRPRRISLGDIIRRRTVVFRRNTRRSRILQAGRRHHRAAPGQHKIDNPRQPEGQEHDRRRHENARPGPDPHARPAGFAPAVQQDRAFQLRRKGLGQFRRRRFARQNAEHLAPAAQFFHQAPILRILLEMGLDLRPLGVAANAARAASRLG